MIDGKLDTLEEWITEHPAIFDAILVGTTTAIMAVVWIVNHR